MAVIVARVLDTGLVQHVAKKRLQGIETNPRGKELGKGGGWERHMCNEEVGSSKRYARNKAHLNSRPPGKAMWDRWLAIGNGSNQRDHIGKASTRMQLC